MENNCTTDMMQFFEFNNLVLSGSVHSLIEASEMFLPRIVNIRPRTVQGAPLATGRIPFPDHLQAEKRLSEIRVGLTHRSGKNLFVKLPQSKK